MLRISCYLKFVNFQRFFSVIFCQLDFDPINVQKDIKDIDVISKVCVIIMLMSLLSDVWSVSDHKNMRIRKRRGTKNADPAGSGLARLERAQYCFIFRLHYSLYWIKDMKRARFHDGIREQINDKHKKNRARLYNSPSF